MKPIVFYHIPKTAGTAVVRILESVVGTENLWRSRFASDLDPLRSLVRAGTGTAAGHFYIKEIRDQLKDFPHFGFAFVRNPMAHVCSNFFHFTNTVIASSADDPISALSPDKVTPSQESAVQISDVQEPAAQDEIVREHIDAAPSHREAHDKEKLATSLHYRNENSNPTHEEIIKFQRKCKKSGMSKILSENNFVGNVLFDNPQVRFILRKSESLTNSDLETAWDVLSSLDYIGISERFSNSMVSICRLIGGDERQLMEMTRRRVNTTLDPDAILRELGSADVVSKIIERTRFDYELYRRSLERYMRGGHKQSAPIKAARTFNEDRDTVVSLPEGDLINIFRSNQTKLINAEAESYLEIDWDYIRLHPNKPGAAPIKLTSPLFNSHGRRFVSGKARMSHELSPRTQCRISALNSRGEEVCGVEVSASYREDTDFTLMIPQMDGPISIQLSTQVQADLKNDYAWADFIHLRID